MTRPVGRLALATGKWAAGCLVALALWWLGSVVLGAPTLPGPAVVLRGFLSEVDVHGANALVSGGEALVGLSIGGVVAGCVVLAAGLLPRSEPMMLPLLTVLKCTPAIAFVPILVAIWGSGFWCNATTAAVIAFFPMVLSGLDGLHSIPDRLELIASSFGATSWRRMRHISGYYAVLGIARGAKTSAPLAVVGALVGEYVGGGRPAGIGTYIATNRMHLQIIPLMEGVVTAALLGLACFSIAYGACGRLERSLRLER